MSASTRKSWNWSLWMGFLFAVAGFLSYTFFAQFPVTRDLPWANLLLFAAGGILLVLGLFRAFGNARVYRGKIFGPILATLAILMLGLFSYVLVYELRQVPPSTGAPRVGQKAPEFTLSDQDGKDVSLRDLVSRSKAVALIFYRGFW
ncbi:MAG TPA: redoxin domain-containing protein [Candidatus Udaeobacter sp.]|nr:redoxin domain-containing protein [Candidatus Udaeobacter sp.]